MFDEIFPMFGVGVHELEIHEVAPDQGFEDCVCEGDITAGTHRKMQITDLRAEKSRFGIGWHPVTLKSRFEVRVDDDDLGTGLLGQIKVFGEHRLIVGHIRAPEHDQIGL